jgi:hypothetical protein
MALPQIDRAPLARTAALALMVAMAVGSSAANAGKLTEAQARKAATDWISAMRFQGDDSAPLDGATALTATSVYAVAYTDEGAKCAETTAVTAATIAKTLHCLRSHVAPSGKPKIWGKKSALHLSGPLLAHAKKIAALGKLATLVEINDGCDGMESWVVLAITKDPKGIARVSAVLSAHTTCGE